MKTLTTMVACPYVDILRDYLKEVDGKYPKEVYRTYISDPILDAGKDEYYAVVSITVRSAYDIDVDRLAKLN